MPDASRDQAMRVSRQLGCRGAHQDANGKWMPCMSHEEFSAILKSKNAYLALLSKQTNGSIIEIDRRVKRLDTKSAEYYQSRQMAMEASKRSGCSGVRTVILGGKKYYAPCRPKGGFEKLGERGIVGIANVDGGGLVSAPVGGKSEEQVVDIDSKGFVNFVSRSTDPDVFLDPDSARVRARNLGCIGIRRYTARDGKTVWLPCTNGSDYNRAMNIRGDGTLRTRRGAQQKKKELAPSLIGSRLEMKAAYRPKRGVPKISSEAVNMLAVRVRRHNASVSNPAYRTNLRDVRAVYLRGLVEGNASEASSRVTKFFRAMSSDKPMPRGQRQDIDLIPDTHPSKDRRTAQKDANFIFAAEGIKIRNGCCPSKVKRYFRI